MQVERPTTADILARGDLVANVTSYARHLRAANLTPATQRTYLASLDRLASFLQDRGMPTDVAAIRREHVEAFMEGLPTGEVATVPMPTRLTFNRPRAEAPLLVEALAATKSIAVLGIRLGWSGSGP